MSDFMYKAEYAKSGRASCKGCKSPIPQDSLRIAVMVQSFHFDGKTPNWYHQDCFFKKQRPKSTDDIEHFESLRFNDQEKVRKLIENLGSVVVPPAKGKKRGANAKNAGGLQDFKIEYAKSARATCRGCEQKIIKEEIRVSKKDFTTEIGMKYGGQDMWHHLSCFAKLRSELGYYADASLLPGFKSLKNEDREEAKKLLPAIKQEEPPEKKAKTEDEVDGNKSSEMKEAQNQNKIMYKYRDQLQDNLSTKELTALMEYNGQHVPSSNSDKLDRLADMMTFGTLAPCEVCKCSWLVFEKFGYKCRGDLTEFTKCNNFVKVPKRVPFKVPKDLAKEHPFLKKYKYVERERIVKDEKPKVAEVKKEEDEADGRKPKIEREKPALYEMEFFIVGRPKRGKDNLKKDIERLGGKVSKTIHNNVMAVIGTKEHIEDDENKHIEKARDADIQVVPEEFVDEAPKHANAIPELITKMNISRWGSNPADRIREAPTKSVKSTKSIYEAKSGKVNLKLKGGGAVDPDSGLDQTAHVYQDNKAKYTVVLTKTDIQTKQNSYYKFQLLKSDTKDKYWVFRSWGRIGTTIGSNKLEKFSNLHEAKESFKALYEERTGNDWEDRHNFVKKPGKYFPIDIDYEEDKAEKLDIVEAPSKLHNSVQELMKLIFDVNSMKKVMLEFELDTEKMPLGKLSKKQIQNAFSVLSELQDLINNKNEPEIKFIDASNRFYSYIPHSFGIENPPVLKDPEIIKQKLEMLDSLMELEIAYNLMKSSGSKHTVDSYYEQLKADIDVLSKDSETFKIIEEYVKNTHAATHSSYELEIQDVFEVKRRGEDKRFKKLHNRKLLWHGSRTTNFAGILSQGLRIAPPEAPVTGYMFGKGIYFADMVSKSANYCCTTPSNPTGLLLLCDVALGNMYEKTEAEYVEKLPKGKHSCKGLGRSHPDPSQVKEIDGAEVPIGKGVPAKVKKSQLLYNEYIVYDTAQVNIKYLLKVNFKYKY